MARLGDVASCQTACALARLPERPILRAKAMARLWLHYMVNYNFLRFMVSMTCTNKIEELKKIQQKVHVNSAEILAIFVEWKKFHDPQRWEQHTASFPKLRSAVDFVYNCISFDEVARTPKTKELKNQYEKEASDDAEADDDDHEHDTESDRSNAAK